MAGDEIVVSPAAILAAANRLKQEALNIQESAQRSDRSVDDLRNMKSNRIDKIIAAWDALLKSINENVQNVEDIAKEQTSAGDDFNKADLRG